MQKINERQEEFCLEYVANFGNASAAYRKAYGDKPSAGRSASDLLKKPIIKERIAELQKQAYEAAALTPEKIGLKLNQLAFDDETPPAAQLKALELLQKQFGLQIQNINANVKNEINITID